MVDLSGGQDGPIEHGFSNTVFIIPGIIFITLSGVCWMDFLQGVKDMDHEEAEAQAEDIVNNVNMADMKMPTVEDLLEALDGMTGMSDEDKQSLRDQLTGKGDGQMPFGMPAPAQGVTYQQMLILFSLLLFVACIFVFFGYKLYKSLVEKERKREEKRKIKQMKKKK
ncbi:uncharacterized protein CBL_08889 [Carabus blaptoides fortunei]